TESGILSLNSTIGNNASSVDGGGLEIVGSTGANFGNVTIFKNTATGNGGNANIGASASLGLTNSILAGGTAATGPDADNAGTLSSGDYNIIQTTPAGNAVSGTTTHNKALDPQLLPLENNGGPTFTFADQASSPGKGYITFSGGNCGTIGAPADQRGFTRGAGGVCDVGAYEFAGVASAARHLRLPKTHFHPHAGGMQVLFPHFAPLRLVLPKLDV
ncbi:MAG: hypothetical protein JO029_03715, partial [Candidatus Eremiobacteraeota bacterium]|nr:hypothetical protein [Candidatus Eremiobacteraeota bacterium]